MKTSFKTLAIVATMLAGTAGIAAAQDGRYYDHDDYRYDNRAYDNNDYGYNNRDYNRESFGRGIHEAREFGLRDGAAVAREDSYRGKPFNPNPRGRFDDADHGYRREFGDKHEYREHYSQAYRAGYQRSYRGYARYDR